MNKISKLLAASALALACAPALAQETVATLQVEAGTVMTSEGGEFQTANTGEALSVGERLMLAENSVAIVRYRNGCDRRYDAPGVYAVPNENACRPVAGAWTGQPDWAAAGIITGAAVVGAALLSQMDEVPGPPPAPISR